MHRSIFWRFRRVEPMNTCLLLGPKGRLLIHILRKPQRIVRIMHFYYVSILKWNHSSNLTFCTSYWQPQCSHNLLDPSTSLNLDLMEGLIQHQFLWTQWIMLLQLPRQIICQLSVYQIKQKVYNTHLLFPTPLPLWKILSLVSFASICLCFGWLLGANNCCSSTENVSTMKPIGETAGLGNHGHRLRGEVSFHSFTIVSVIQITLQVDLFHGKFYGVKIRITCDKSLKPTHATYLCMWVYTYACASDVLNWTHIVICLCSVATSSITCNSHK